MSPPVQFLVRRVGQWKSRTLHSPWRLQLKYGITDQQKVRILPMSVSQLSLYCTGKRGGLNFLLVPSLPNSQRQKKNICENRSWIVILVDLFLLISTYGYWFLASQKELCFPLSFVIRMKNHKMRISICFVLYPENLALSPVRMFPLRGSGVVQVAGQVCISSQPASQLGAWDVKWQAIFSLSSQAGCHGSLS